MTRSLRLALVLVLTSSILVVVPGAVTATVPGGVGRIVYVSDAEDPLGDIYVREFSGGSPIRLTTSTEPDGSPQWSPDGTLIAFGRANSGNGGTDLFVMNADGSSKVNLAYGITTNIPLAWSPDSMRILMLSDRGGNPDLWIIRPDGSDPVQLTNTAELERHAAWSPDGSTIVYDRITPGSSNLWLMDFDGTNQRSLTGTTGIYMDPAWSPDGTKIVYLDGNTGVGDIWVMDADGSQRINLTNSGTVSEVEPAWSPDGAKISFTSDVDGDNDIWAMNPDGTGKSHVTDHVGGESDADWESVNRDPVAVDDRVDSKRGREVVISPLANDSDPDGAPIVISDVTRMPAEGTVVIDGDTITYTHSGAMPPPGHGYPYEDSFEYEIQDERLGSARATVSVWLFPTFDDVPESSLFAVEIEWLALQGITFGCNPPDNTLFCPDEFVTRAQMAAFLVRSQGYGAGAGNDLFVDDNGSVFELDIDRLGTAGVTRGCNPPVNDRFCPDGLVTRGQMAAFLVRAYQLPAPATGDLFIDDDESVFEDDIDRLGASGVTRGCNPPKNDRYCPDQFVTREQMAAFLFRVGPPAT